jgi:hypothetical protein
VDIFVRMKRGKQIHYACAEIGNREVETAFAFRGGRKCEMRNAKWIWTRKREHENVNTIARNRGTKTGKCDRESALRKCGLHLHIGDDRFDV